MTPPATSPAMPGKPRDLQERTHVEDGRLMQRVASGDRLAFDTLYQRYLRRLMGYLQRRLGQPELVEEVCQDVFLAVWEQAPHFRGQSQVSTWLFGIARRQALKVLAVHPRPDPPIASVALPDPSPLEASLRTQERLRALKRALATLPLAQRQLVEMVYYQDCPYEAIADCLGCSVTTVKTRLRHARRQLGMQLIREDRVPASPQARAACYSAMPSVFRRVVSA